MLTMPVVLGIGLPFLPLRMDQYNTRFADPGGYRRRGNWTYQVLRNRAARYGVIAFFTLVNGFLIGMPLGQGRTTEGSYREISSWVSAVTALSVFGFGQLVALYIICFVRVLKFRQTSVLILSEGGRILYVPHNNRMWVLEYPDLTQPYAWKEVFTPLSWNEIKGRLVDNAEATLAAKFRDTYSQQVNTHGSFGYS